MKITRMHTAFRHHWLRSTERPFPFEFDFSQAMDESASSAAGTIPSSISKQKDAFLAACGVSTKGGKRATQTVSTAIDDEQLIRAVLPFIKAQLANEKFDFGTMFSSVQQQVRLCALRLRAYDFWS
jgi:hypothetical protein